MKKVRMNTESTLLLSENHTEKTILLKRRPTAASKSRKIAVLICCIVQLLVCSGIGYGLSVMYAELVVVFNAKRADAALLQSLNMGLSCMSGILIAGVMKKFGPGICIAVGCLISGIGLFASAFASRLEAIILCTGVISGLALGIQFLAAYVTIGWMFPDSASFYLICLTGGISIGQFIFPLLFELFISQYSWSGAFLCLSAVSLNCIPCGITIHYSSEHFVTGRDSPKTNAFCDRTLLQDFVIWLLLINFLLYAMTGNMEAWFLVDHVVTQGFTRESGAILVSVIGIGSCVGRIFGGILRLTCKCPTMYHWIYLYLILSALHGAIVNIHEFWSLLVTCLLYGIMFATSASQAPAIMFEASGFERYPQGMALANIMSGIGDTIGPLLGGFLKDLSGEYNVVFYIAAGASVYISVSTAVTAYIIRLKRLRNGHT
ncbi:monocarboxylate transporter 9-like [Mercenaria mercenaria]|uniref:monocarboxylate transporter 9-like n=1 Tax=Mercenaria mercenaria TaxID=6596 RepID=UPI00234F1A38|nr:monocarboxylate transporter 9-like [Mercenaria mercenaria]